MILGAALHGELTSDGRTIVLIGTGPDHAIEAMAKWIQLVTPLVKPSDPPGALTLPATWAAVVQLSHLFGSTWQPGARLTAWLGEQLQRRTRRDGPLYQPPEGLVPREYQREGAAMIAELGRGLLFDEAGTGKTITTIVGLVTWAATWRPARPGDTPGQLTPEHGPQFPPVLVIAPASVVDPWVEAWRTWAPHVRAIAYRGSPDRRRKLIGAADVYVTSYDTARSDAAKGRPLDRLAAKAVVVDECHQIKSPHAGRSLAARRLARRADAYVALSGTPITHHPGDLWPALEALSHDAWPSNERWKARYCVTQQGDYSAKVLGLRQDTEQELRTALLGQHRRVAKADVLTQLPPKVYSVRTVELPAQWRKAYDAMEKDMIAALPDGTELTVMSVLAQLTRLSQLASAAADVRVTVEPDAEGELREHVAVTLKAPSWKVDALLEVLAERPGEPVVAFAPSRQLMTLAGQQATKAGLQVGYVVGGQTPKERTETVDRFQMGKLDLLCATTGAGGVGLTLTAARTVVFLQRPWSFVEASQAEDRCHRIGSERHDSIEIIDIVAADTVDSRVRAVLREKAGQLSDLLQDPRIVSQLLGGIK